MSIDDQFDDIANSALQSAARVQCTVREYQGGLRWLIERIKEELQASLETSGDDD